MFSEGPQPGRPFHDLLPGVADQGGEGLIRPSDIPGSVCDHDSTSQVSQQLLERIQVGQSCPHSSLLALSAREGQIWRKMVVDLNW